MTGSPRLPEKSTDTDLDVRHGFFEHAVPGGPVVVHDLRRELYFEDVDFFDGLDGDRVEVGDDLHTPEPFFGVEAPWPLR